MPAKGQALGRVHCLIFMSSLRADSPRSYLIELPSELWATQLVPGRAGL